MRLDELIKDENHIYTQDELARLFAGRMTGEFTEPDTKEIIRSTAEFAIGYFAWPYLLAGAMGIWFCISCYIPVDSWYGFLSADNMNNGRGTMYFFCLFAMSVLSVIGFLGIIFSLCDNGKTVKLQEEYNLHVQLEKELKKEIEEKDATLQKFFDMGPEIERALNEHKRLMAEKEKEIEKAHKIIENKDDLIRKLKKTVIKKDDEIIKFKLASRKLNKETINNVDETDPFGGMYAD